MKKYLALLFIITILNGCNDPVGRSWIIPVSIDPSDVVYTPVQMESFEKRRSVVLDSMEGGFLIIKSTDQYSYNRHGFRPNNYFFYLTGLSAPGTFLILGKQEVNHYMLSLPQESNRTLIYHGGNLPAGQMKAQYGPDRLLSYSEVRMVLDTILNSGALVYTDLGNSILMDELKQIGGEGSLADVRSAAGVLDEMRVFKDPLEVERIQKACNITSWALARVMKQCKPGMYEFEMESVIEGTFLEFGSSMPGFPSIMGSGPNSTILHYETNNRMMESGELLLMDIGAEYGYYTADITRTIPVNGKFSTQQRTIYQLVLDAQLAAIEQLKPGNGFMDGHLAARKVLVDGLTKLGLITNPESPWQIRFYILYPSSHFLGLDVHDVGDMGGSFHQFLQETPDSSIESRTLEPGMVLTIEPGLYFREEGLEQVFRIFGHEADSAEICAFVEEIRPVYESYRNIGIRIEDDILITEEGNINLSRYAPKEIDDIEQLMR